MQQNADKLNLKHIKGVKQKERKENKIIIPHFNTKIKKNNITHRIIVTNL